MACLCFPTLLLIFYHFNGWPKKRSVAQVTMNRKLGNLVSISVSWLLALSKTAEVGCDFRSRKSKGQLNETHNWLVVWNIIFMNFHILEIILSQLTKSYFQRGGLTTNQINFESWKMI